MDSAALSASALEEFFEAPDLSDMDPSVAGGFRVTYAREVPLEMRLQTSDAAPADAGTLEAIYCKVAVRDGDDGRPRAVKIELTSEADIFFHYVHTVDEKEFAAMREEQKLMVDFPTYSTVLATSFHNAIKVRAAKDRKGRRKPAAASNRYARTIAAGLRAKPFSLRLGTGPREKSTAGCIQRFRRTLYRRPPRAPFEQTILTSLASEPPASDIETSQPLPDVLNALERQSCLQAALMQRRCCNRNSSSHFFTIPITFF